MFSQIGVKIRSFLVGDTRREEKPSRKRSFESAEDDLIVTPAAKKARPITNGHSSWPFPPLGKVADWVAKSKASFSESYYVRQLKESPHRLVDKISTLSGAGASAGPDMRGRGRGHNQQSRSSASSHGPVGFSGLDPRKMPPNVHVVPHRDPRLPSPIQAQQTPRTAYSTGYNFSQPQLNLTQPSFNFSPAPPAGMARYPYMMPGQTPTFQGSHNTSRSQPQRSNGHYRQQKPQARYGGQFPPKQTRHHFQSTRSRNSMAVKESIRLDEKTRYARLIKQFDHPTPVLGDITFGSSYMRRPPQSTFTLLGTEVKPASNQDVLPPSEPSQLEPEPTLGDKPSITERSFLELRAKRTGRGEREHALRQNETSRNKALARIAKPLFLKTSVEDQRSERSSSPEIIAITPPTIPRSPIVVEEFEKVLKDSKYASDDWFHEMKGQFSPAVRQRERQIQEEEVKVRLYKEKREQLDEQIERSIRNRLTLAEREPPVLEDEYIEEQEPEDEEDELPELTDEQEQTVENALRRGPSEQILVEAYRLQVMRKDIATLAGLNWLNDEVINFYMNMLMDRGTAEGNPKVHAFNTFFYPKVMSSGHAGVRRWTRRVDVLAVDYILVPVHLGMHWCLAIVDFRKKEIRYYDSMGGRNNACLNALKQYLNDESLDKKKQPFDTSDWKLLTMTDIPQQMNGSDCGMFTCKFAEYITRDAPITFSQEHMPYFRRRMVLEIVTKQLL